MSLIFRLIIIAFAFVLVSKFVPGIVVESLYIAFVLGVFWGIMNYLVKPVLMVLTLPINFLTLGLFTLVINGFLFWLLSTFVKGFHVESFLAAIIGAVIISIFNWIGDMLFSKD